MTLSVNQTINCLKPENDNKGAKNDDFWPAKGQQFNEARPYQRQYQWDNNSILATVCKGNAKQTDQSLLNTMPLAFEVMSKDRCPFAIFYNGDGQNNAETNLTTRQQGRARVHDAQTSITGAGQNAGGVVLNSKHHILHRLP